MTFEVELKFPIGDLTPIRQRLDLLGASWLPAVEQQDTYFAHPQRDFADTDEALRIRRTAAGVVLTYKGPRVFSTAKSRREIEVPVDSSSAGGLRELLLSLGFVPVADVCKRRIESAIEYNGHRVHVALDEVDGLGSFVELELLATAEQAEAAGRVISDLAADLGLSQPEPRSYLEMLLERSQAARGA